MGQLSDRTHWFRKADMTYLIVVMTLCGAVWAVIKEPMKWDQTTMDVEAMKPRLDRVEQHVTEIDARNQAQMTLIIRELDGIHKEIRRQNRGDD